MSAVTASSSYVVDVASLFPASLIGTALARLWVADSLQNLLVPALDESGLAATCPITLAPIEHPVLLADGFVYEEAEICKWLQNHTEAPLTNAALEHLCVLRLEPLQAAIEYFLLRSESNPETGTLASLQRAVRDATRTDTPLSNRVSRLEGAISQAQLASQALDSCVDDARKILDQLSAELSTVRGTAAAKLEERDRKGLLRACLRPWRWYTGKKKEMRSRERSAKSTPDLQQGQSTSSAGSEPADCPFSIRHRFETDSPGQACASCGITDVHLFACKRCRRECYCSFSCQRKRWTKHQVDCSKAQASDAEPRAQLDCGEVQVGQTVLEHMPGSMSALSAHSAPSSGSGFTGQYPASGTSLPRDSLPRETPPSSSQRLGASPQDAFGGLFSNPTSNTSLPASSRESPHDGSQRLGAPPQQDAFGSVFTGGCPASGTSMPHSRENLQESGSQRLSPPSNQEAFGGVFAGAYPASGTSLPRSRENLVPPPSNQWLMPPSNQEAFSGVFEGGYPASGTSLTKSSQNLKESSQRGGESPDAAAPFGGLLSNKSSPLPKTCPELGSPVNTPCFECNRLFPKRPHAGICDDCFRVYLGDREDNHCLAYCGKCERVIDDVVSPFSGGSCGYCSEPVEPTCAVWRARSAGIRVDAVEARGSLDAGGIHSAQEPSVPQTAPGITRGTHSALQQPVPQSAPGITRAVTSPLSQPVLETNEPPKVEQNLSSLLADLGEDPSVSPWEPLIHNAALLSAPTPPDTPPLEDSMRREIEISLARAGVASTHRLHQQQLQASQAGTGNLITDVRHLIDKDWKEM